MEYGYVCFAYSKNEWIAKVIAWFTKSQWSHCFITVPPMLEQEMVMEASEGGVEMITFNSAYRNNPTQKYEVYKVNCSQESTDQAILTCMGQLEVGYGFKHYPWFMWRSLCKLFGKDIKSQDNWCHSGDVCSDLTRLRLESGGLKDLLAGFGKNSASAQDLYEIVKTYPEFFELIESKN